MDDILKNSFNLQLERRKVLRKSKAKLSIHRNSLLVLAVMAPNASSRR